MIRVVDLFCGLGGLSYGLDQAGLTILKGIDVDSECRYAYESNLSVDFICEDVAELDGDYLGNMFGGEDDYTLLAGCPPCQPFSGLTRGGEQTPRKRLLPKFGELVKHCRPDMVVMENVPRVRHSPEFLGFVDVLKECGYHTNGGEIVQVAQYGLPQNRRRLVLMASKSGDIGLLPPEPIEIATVRSTIEHLSEIEAGGSSNSDRIHKSAGLSDTNLQRIRASKQGGTWKDWPESLRSPCHRKSTGQSFSSVYGRMGWDTRSPTITTEFYSYGSGRFGHPEQHRALSLREGALLQTFPTDYEFVAEDQPVRATVVGRMIGNAVPPQLGEIIGESIRHHLGM